jgi:hypothetical protein
MDSFVKNVKRLYLELQERKKELKCIYEVDQVLSDKDENMETIFRKMVNLIPHGWQYPTITQVRISYAGKVFSSDDFKPSQWFIQSPLIVDKQNFGKIEVYYTQLIRIKNGTQFLPEEQELLNTIASRLSNFILYKRIERSLEILEKPEGEKSIKNEDHHLLTNKQDQYSIWRWQMAQLIADRVDIKDYGIKGIYLIGSSKNMNSGPASDIDLMIHMDENTEKRSRLSTWLDGWSQCLSEINFQQTGYKTSDLLDIHFISDDDIARKTSFAVMLNSKENTARRLR